MFLNKIQNAYSRCKNGRGEEEGEGEKCVDDRTGRSIISGASTVMVNVLCNQFEHIKDMYPDGSERRRGGAKLDESKETCEGKRKWTPSSGEQAEKLLLAKDA